MLYRQSGVGQIKLGRRRAAGTGTGRGRGREAGANGARRSPPRARNSDSRLDTLHVIVEKFDKEIILTIAATTQFSQKSA